MLTKAFGSWPKVEIAVEPLEHLRWKLEGGRSGGYPAIIVEQDGALVGAYIIAIRRVKFGGRVLTATGGSDVAVLPEYREQGVFGAIADHMRSENHSRFDLSLFYRSGHEAVTRVVGRAERGLFGNYVEVHVADLTARLHDTGSGPLTVREVAAFDERINGFWEAASQPFDFIPARTRDYLDWRYCDRRGGAFSTTIAEAGEHVLGYLITRTSLGRGYIADALALPGRLDVVAALTSEALTRLAATGIHTVECWLPARHPYGETLARYGFVRMKTSPRFMYRGQRASEAELSILRDPATAVHLMIGDTDLV